MFHLLKKPKAFYIVWKLSLSIKLSIGPILLGWVQLNNCLKQSSLNLCLVYLMIVAKHCTLIHQLLEGRYTSDTMWLHTELQISASTVYVMHIWLLKNQTIQIFYIVYKYKMYYIHCIQLLVPSGCIVGSKNGYNIIN